MVNSVENIDFNSLGRSFRDSKKEKFWNGKTINVLNHLVTESEEKKVDTSEYLHNLCLLKEVEKYTSRRVKELKASIIPQYSLLCEKEVQLMMIKTLGEVMKEKVSDHLFDFDCHLGLDGGVMSVQEQVITPYIQGENSISNICSRIKQGVSDTARFLKADPHSIRFKIEGSFKSDYYELSMESDGIDPVQEMLKFIDSIDSFDIDEHYYSLVKGVLKVDISKVRDIYDLEVKGDLELSIKEKKIVLAKQILNYLSVSMIGSLALALGPSGTTLEHSDDVELTVGYNSENKAFSVYFNEINAKISYIGVSRSPVYLADINVTSDPLKDKSLLMAQLK
jgi:hypothetical protein